MERSKLAGNILSQAASLAHVLRYQSGDGAMALKEAAALLRSERPVVITGMGASLFAAIPLEYSLCSLGVDAISIEAGEFLHYRHCAYRNAVVIMVSRSGESIEIARLLAVLKDRQPVIGISNEPQSLLSKSANVSISISSLPDEIVAIQTYTATLVVLQLLASGVAGTLAKVKESIEMLLPQFSASVEMHMDGRKDWDSFLSPERPVYLLARGPSCASAHEGALLFHEIAKSPAVSMALASFRHGPVEVVDSNFRGLVFAPEGQTRALNLALARDVLRFGGHVRVIGPANGALEEELGHAATEVPEMLAPLFEIVPVQSAALRMAELRGILPGSFRYAPQVAIDEASFSRKEPPQ